ncbi:MAG: lipoyltransferase [Prevotella sp.]|nr:lipoyltransferase [Prevotella sp.]
MIYIALPTTSAEVDTALGQHEATGRRLSFYLAMEEYVARRLNTGEDCFFMWQVKPTVIFGRNQLIENEVNLDFCRQRGIEMYRRKSGGGCVYADMGNVMFSYVTRDENVNFTFNRYINLVALVLYKLGIEAKASGRNDVLIAPTQPPPVGEEIIWRKVSGNAFYHIPGHSIVHGTMLYDTNMENMVGAITPSNEKLVSKGVESVRQHIALLKDHTNVTLEEFKAFVRKNLCDSELTLTDEDIRCIEEKEKEYLSDEFIYGRNPHYSVTRRKRLEGVGEMEARMELKNGIIKRINLLGDFFVVGDLDSQLLNVLRNVRLSEEALRQALPEQLDDVILHLDRSAFIRFLTEP